MMTDLQKQIEELENYIKFKPDTSLEDTLACQAFVSGINSGVIHIKKAISIIKQLQHELKTVYDAAQELVTGNAKLQEEADKYKLLWESACEGAKVIIAELEEENRCLKKQYEGALGLATNLQTKLEKNNDK